MIAICCPPHLMNFKCSAASQVSFQQCPSANDFSFPILRISREVSLSLTIKVKHLT